MDHLMGTPDSHFEAELGGMGAGAGAAFRRTTSQKGKKPGRHHHKLGGGAPGSGGRRKRRAAAAGLRADDVVTQFDDHEITSMGDLVTALRHLDPGDEVRIGYLRSGEHHWCQVTLAQTA